MSRAIFRPAFAAAALLAIGGCSTYDNGYGYGRSSSYNDNYYPSSGASYSAYYGWYGDYYYPGSGYYVYNRGGDRYRWSDTQRHYWEGRRDRRETRENWSDYRRERADDRREWRDDRRDDRREWRGDRRDDRRDDRRGRHRGRDD